MNAPSMLRWLAALLAPLVALPIDPATGETRDGQTLAGHRHPEGPFPERSGFLA
jgi:hypothetical protein